MLKLRNALNVYSELNTQIDFIILVDDNYVVSAYDFIKRFYDEWMEQDIDEPIADYISNKLSEANVEHEIYFKN